MSDPIVQPGDLGTYLNDPNIDVSRAMMMLSDAQTLCESILVPLPLTAAPIIRRIAARGYVNVSSAQTLAIGTAHIGYGPSTQASPGSGGMYLSRSDKSDLRRLAGGGGAFTIDMLPPGVSEVQSLTVAASAGTFVLSLAGSSTSAVAYSGDAPTIQIALAALPNIGAGNVIVTGSGGNFSIRFAGTLANQPVALVAVDTTALTGTAVVVETVAGQYPPASGLPWWDQNVSFLDPYAGFQ